MLRRMVNDVDPPSGPLDQHGAASLAPDEPNPARRTSRRYHHLRSIAENAELEAAFRQIDTLGLMRLCIIRLAETGSRKEADRIREELAHYLPEPLLDAMIRQATAVSPPPPKPARRKPTPRPSSDPSNPPRRRRSRPPTPSADHPEADHQPTVAPDRPARHEPAASATDGSP